MSSLKMTREGFNTEMGVFGSTAKQQWDRATKLAVTAVLFYREDNDSLLVAELHEMFTNADSGDFRVAFEKMTWSLTNLKFKQDEEDQSKAVTVSPKGENPATYVDAITNTEKNGLKAWGAARKSASKAKKLNQNGEKPVKLITSTDDPTNGAEMTAEQQAQATAANEQHKKTLESILAGTYKPDEIGGGSSNTADFGIHFKDDAQAADFGVMVAAMAEVSVMDPEKLNGAIKHCINQMSQVKTALVKLAQVG